MRQRSAWGKSTLRTGGTKFESSRRRTTRRSRTSTGSSRRSTGTRISGPPAISCHSSCCTSRIAARSESAARRSVAIMREGRGPSLRPMHQHCENGAIRAVSSLTRERILERPVTKRLRLRACRRRCDGPSAVPVRLQPTVAFTESCASPTTRSSTRRCPTNTRTKRSCASKGRARRARRRSGPTRARTA